MKTASLWLTLPLVASMTVAGCASQPTSNAQLEQAQSELDALKQDPTVQAHAPATLLDAEGALKRAERAHEDDDKASRDHQLYLSQRYLEIARVTAQRGVAEQEIAQLSEERDRLALSEREQELATQREELSTRESEVEEAQARSRELEAELAALEARRTDRGMLLTLDDVFFKTASASIAPGATPGLVKIVEFLSENPDQHIVVEGHTDSVGDTIYNQQLSEQRAGAVKQLIVARGIESDRVDTRGYGESRPVASNENEGGRQLNRRVEIIFPDTAQ